MEPRGIQFVPVRPVYVVTGVNEARPTINQDPVLQKKSAKKDEVNSNKLKCALQDLVRTIRNGEQDNFAAAFYKYYNVVSNLDENYELSTNELRAFARDRYKQFTGNDIIDDIYKYSHGSMTQGFINGLTFDILGQKRTAEEIVSSITELPQSKTENLTKKTGKVAGTATAGAIMGATAGSFVPGVGTAAGALIGGATGAGVAILKELINGIIH